MIVVSVLVVLPRPCLLFGGCGGDGLEVYSSQCDLLPGSGDDELPGTTYLCLDLFTNKWLIP